MSVNYSRMIFDLKVYDSCRLPTFNSADKHRQTAFLYCLSGPFQMVLINSIQVLAPILKRLAFNNFDLGLVCSLQVSDTVDAMP